MKKRKYVTGRALLIAALFSTFTIPGLLGTPNVMAAPMEQQQTGVINGTVVDETGETVIGATITVKGGDASKGTITDFDGNFSIQCLPKTACAYNSRPTPSRCKVWRSSLMACRKKSP